MKNLLIGLSLVLSFALGFCCAYTQRSAQSVKDYEAACLLMDCMRSMMDSEEIGSEVEESYYEWFSDLDTGCWHTKKLHDIKDLDQYYWAY